MYVPFPAHWWCVDGYSEGQGIAAMLVAFLSDALASNGNIKISLWYEQLCHQTAAVEVTV